MIKYILLLFLSTTLLSSCATTVQKSEMSGEVLYNKGMDYLEVGDAERSLEYLLEAYNLSKESYGANLGLGDAYLKLGQPEKALEHYAYYNSGKNNIYGYERLIQVYQALSMLEQRNSKISELKKQWVTLLEDKPVGYIRDSFLDLDMKLIAFEEFAPNRPNMIFYRCIQTDQTKRSTFVSLGSYDLTSEITRELEGKADDWRIYHLDGYCNGGHKTYGFYDEKPTYEQVRKTVVEIYKNNDFGC